MTHTMDPSDRDRALALRRRLTTAVGIGSTAAVGAIACLVAATAPGVTTPSTAARTVTAESASAATSTATATAAPTASPTLQPSSSSVSSASSGSAHAVSGGSGG